MSEKKDFKIPEFNPDRLRKKLVCPVHMHGWEILAVPECPNDEVYIVNSKGEVTRFTNIEEVIC